LFFLLGLPLAQAAAQQNQYLWSHSSRKNIEQRIPVPEGFVRVPVAPGSFADWLRHLPLKPGRPEVHLFSGEPRWNQSAHFAVIDIDLPREDLQQCADSIIRLRAEYLYSIKDYRSIHFRFTSGDDARFDKYAQGYRPKVAGNIVSWAKTAPPDNSYQTFRSYLLPVFRYAGTFSLSKEMLAVPDPAQMQIGDVFIRGGFPGHAMIVVDMAENPQTHEKIFLLAQGYNPAVEMHVVKNPEDDHLNPWYSTKFGEVLDTPQYTFRANELKRFAKSAAEAAEK